LILEVIYTVPFVGVSDVGIRGVAFVSGYTHKKSLSKVLFMGLDMWHSTNRILDSLGSQSQEDGRNSHKACPTSTRNG